MAFTTTRQGYGTQRLNELCERFERDDPTLTDDDVNELRSNTSTNRWFEMTSAKVARDVERAKKVTPIGAGRTQLQIATEYRERAKEVLTELMLIINEARRDHNMAVNFQIGPPDGFNQQHLMMLEVTTKIC